MRPTLQLLVALALCTLAGCGDAPEHAPTGGGERALQRRWDGSLVLLVVFDALHATHVTHLGYERDTTPNLDRLARAGVSFARAYSTAPYTRAGIPSIHTGRLPEHHGMRSGEEKLAREETTAAELFDEIGAPTRGAVGNLYGSEVYGVDQGFREFHDHALALEGRSADLVEGGVAFHTTRAKEFTARTIGWMDADPSGPAFWYLHYLEPHYPYVREGAWRKRYLDPDYDGEFRAMPAALINAVNRGEVAMDDDDVAAAVALYDATLAYADHHFGDVLDELERRGLYDDALIVVTSDHGEAHQQHGRLGHNVHLYDEMVHVPLIVKFPKGRGPVGVIDRTVVSHMDVLPSLVEWCGLAQPPLPLDGVSLERALELPDDAERELVLRTNEEIPDLGLRTRDTKTIVVRDAEGNVVRTEHYDLAADPGERVDTASTAAALVDARRAMLLGFERDSAAVRSRSEPVDRHEGILEVLASLGYSESGDAVPDASTGDDEE
ncbi:MAG: sulfatase [Planctomycetota bacterium]